MKESLIVGSKTRAALKAKGVNVGAGTLDALNAIVHWHIDQAAERAAANKRKTVRPHDFVVIEDEEDPPAEPPTPPESHEHETEAAPVGGDHVQAAVADVGEAAEEVAEEEPPAWPR
jgi:hypothetical protein